MIMTHKQRKNVVRACKRKNLWWTGNEVDQDRLIEEACQKRGFTLQEFYAEEGKILEKLLS
jgi:hypothetical protein